MDSSKPLRVVMPVLSYVPDNMGGSERYARELVAGLDARDDVDLTVIATRVGAGALGARNEHVVNWIRGGASTSARLGSVTLGLVADGRSRELLGQADVVHYPFTVPTPMPSRGRPWITTLFDVQYLDLPDMFSSAERAFRALAHGRAARSATRLVTVSEFCRARIADRLRIPMNRIDVAHLGVDVESFSFGVGPRDAFVLYPATAWPHKNHARLLSAMELLRREGHDLRLVLTGGRRDALGDLPAWADHRGHVSDAELVTLYQHASCLVVPSVYEGFGMPPLEAFATELPVAAARSGSLPEICGDAAEYFDPNDARDIARGILVAIEDRSRLVSAGRTRALSFTWEKCVEAHVTTYLRASSATSVREK
jgi:glycosyltransferase involved in cell wall biosynthesis